MPPPPPPSPSGGQVTPRYVYLITRLRTRQITMEEATELFSVMQGMIRDAQSAVPPPPPPSAGGTSRRGPGGLGGLNLGEDGMWIAMLALGTGAGLAAALMKRLEGGTPPPPAARPRPKTDA